MDRYNPSLIEHDGRTLLAYRQCPPGYTWVSKLYLADLDGSKATNPRPLHVPAPTGTNDGVSDPRLFHYQGRLCVSYSYDQSHFQTTNVSLAEINPDGTAVTGKVFPRLYDNHMEKNWQFFDHEGELLIVYAVGPDHVVLDLNLREVARTPGVVCPGAAVRGGTPPVRRGDHYVSFFHNTYERPGGFRNRYYTVGAYAFEANPPFRVIRQSTAPVLVPVPAHRPPGNERPDVVFPCGAIPRANGTWDMSYGYFDAHCRLLNLADPFTRADPAQQGEVIQWA